MTTTWQPGDPIHLRSGGHGGYLFGMRDDSESERCCCSDAARWPEPLPGRVLPGRDEFEVFIAEVRLEREELAS